MGARGAARRAAKSASRLYTIPTAAFRGVPDFLIIGTQRGGTTSLYRYLEQHPNVMPAILNKGIHYFDTGYGHGLDWYRSHFPSNAARALRRRKVGGSPVITGEGSPYYSFHPLAVERIAADLPDARCILMLRDPAERAYSHHQHETARGFEDLPFEDALEAEDERLAGEEERLLADPTYYSYEHQHHSYAARGLYLRQILRWHQHFPPSQLLIVDSAEFFSDPDTVFRAVLRFLGLEERSLPRYDKLNAHTYDRMSPAARDLLAERLTAPTRALFDHLGRSFDWKTATG
jgi:hypothetical protein